MRKRRGLNDIPAFTISFHLSNEVWGAVMKWDYFSKDTIGKQFVRSVDSVAANIAESFGRHSKRDKIKFLRYSRSSVHESLAWNEMAWRRGLLNQKQYKHFYDILHTLPKQVNALIKHLNSSLTI